MRLTKQHKEQIVRRILADVPRTDYEAMANKLVIDEMLLLIPPQLAWAYRAAPDWLSISRRWVGSSLSLRLPVEYSIPETTVQKVRELAQACQKQSDALRELNLRLGANFANVPTRKVFLERFPEFAKYAPAEPAKEDRTLPVDGSLFEQLKAAGWPKDSAA